MTTALRSFTEWLEDHAQGQVVDEMTVALAEVVQAVQTHGKAGSVTLKIKVDLAGSIGSRSVQTVCKVTTAPPEPAGEQSIFFVGEGGSLHREDPYQTRADFGGARTPTTEAGEPRLPNTPGDNT